MAAGEVLLNGSQSGTAGISGYPLSNLTDANALTGWVTATTAAAAGIDAGAPCTLTRVRYSPIGGAEDYMVGVKIQASSTLFAFVTNPTIVNYRGLDNYLAVPAPTSVTVVLNFAQTSGNSLVVYVNPFTVASTISITDTAGNTYALKQGSSGGSNAKTFLASGIVSSAASANTLTISLSPAAYAAIQIVEVTNLLSNPYDSSSSNSGSGTTSSTSITTTGTNDIVIAFCDMANGGTASALNGFSRTGSVSATSGQGVSAPNSATESGVFSPGTYIPSFFDSVSGAWQITAISLKGTSGTGNYVPNITTISSRPITGTLLNEVIIPPGYNFRYYQLMFTGIGTMGDLDFIAQYYPGVVGQVVTPVISPPGGQYDQPTVVRISSLTTDAVFYYTLDGSTPTISSTPYYGPFAITSSATIKVIGVSPGLTNSRIASAQFNVPATMVSTNSWFDNRGYKVWAAEPNIFQDPQSGWWYLYGENFDQPGVISFGTLALNIYKSADLVNWIYVGTMAGPSIGTADGVTNNLYLNSQQLLYNPSTQTYVMWISTYTNTAGTFASGGAYVWTASNPEGPWTQFAHYTSILGYSFPDGDMGSFVDPVTGFAYIIFNVNNQVTTLITRLNSAWTNVDGSNYVAYPMGSSGPFGHNVEAHNMFYKNGTYFWMVCIQNGWYPDTNLVLTNTTGPLGTWGGLFNPFANVVVPQTASEVAVGITPSYTNAYDGQTARGVLHIPGRNAIVWLGDRWDNGFASGSQTIFSTTLNMQSWIEMILPVVFSGSSFTITWNNAWTLDGAYPTVSGAPMAASNLSVTGGLATWVNNEPNPASIYFDASSDPGFSHTVSEVLPYGANSFQISITRPYYRIRTVNANGTTVSQTSITPSIYTPGGIALGNFSSIQRKWNERNTAPKLPTPVN